MVIDVDDRSRVVNWNRRAERVLQVAEADARGRELGELAPLADGGSWAEVLASDDPAPRVRTITRADEPLRLETWSQVLRDAQGRPVGATLYGHDVTARVRSERRHALESELLAAIIRNINITVWALDERGDFLYQDGKASVEVGLKPHQFVGLNVFEAFPGNPGNAHVRRALAGETVRDMNAEAMGHVWDSWYIPLTGRGEDEPAMAAVSIDVSEARRREGDLQAKIDLIQQQQDVIRELSTPIIEVWEGVITLPIVGLLDSVRTAEVMDSLLQAVGRLRARYAILDLTGVEVVDTATASHLIGMLQAVRLLGAEGILTGIQPTIAQTIVTLGVDLKHVTVHARLRDALLHCIRRLDGRRPRA